MISVLLVDDFPLIREGFASALRDDPAIEVVGQAEAGDEALRLAADLQPSVLVLDLFMPNVSGLMVLERLPDVSPATRALVVSASERAEVILEALALGAGGYLTKRCTPDELRQAVISVHGGGSVISPALAGHLLRQYAIGRRTEREARPQLAARETEILRLVAQGRTDREIAALLHVSPRTVQNNLTRIRERTGLRRRAELATWAVQHAVT